VLCSSLASVKTNSEKNAMNIKFEIIVIFDDQFKLSAEILKNKQLSKLISGWGGVILLI